MVSGRNLINLWMIFIGLVPSFAHAQVRTGSITGALRDNNSRTPLEGATIAAVYDSSGAYITYASSNKKGIFTLSGLPFHVRLSVLVAYTGYRDTSALFMLDGSKEMINSGDWRLTLQRKELDTVTVTGRRPPFIVRKDTLEFNAASFKSLPGDMVQDLLRKLPGMIVDEQGNITVNGKKVDKILVDGREFFTGNLKIAIQNLPGDVVDKVQVTDTRDPSQAYTNVVKPIAKTSTLNLTLKKESKQNLVGQANAGAGTSDRYQGTLFVNAFREKWRLGFYGMTGNVSGFGGEAIQAGSMQGSSGGSSGLLKNSTLAAANFNGDIGKIKLGIDYSFNSMDQSAETLLDRTNLLPDSSFLYNSKTEADNKNSGHRVNANITMDNDSLQKLIINAGLDVKNNTGLTVTSALSTTTVGDFINSQQSRNQKNESGTGFSSSLSYSRFSRDKKTVLTVNWALNLNQNLTKEYNRSQNVFSGPASPTADLDQYVRTTGSQVGNNVFLNLNRKLGNHLMFLLNYNFTQDNSNNYKDAYNYNAGSSKYDLLDSTYSNHARNTSVSHSPGFSFGYTNDKLSAAVVAGMLFSRQDNRNIWGDSTITVIQHNFTPGANFSYKFSPAVQLFTNYTVMTTAPTREQLYPVKDNSNPLLIRTGNPFLRSTLTHAVNSQLTWYSADFKWHGNLLVSGNLVGNQITDNSYFDSLGRQVITYSNVNGTWSGNAMMDGGTAFTMDQWKLSVSLGATINVNHNVGFINQQINRSSNRGVSPNLNLEVSYKTVFSFTAYLSTDIFSTTYSLPGQPDVSYNIQRMQVTARVNPLKRLQFRNSMLYTFNSQLPSGYQRSRVILNSSVLYNFLRSGRLSVGLSVNDLLNQNGNTNRTVTPISVQTTQTNTLRRYGMLTIGYRLS